MAKHYQKASSAKGSNAPKPNRNRKRKKKSAARVVLIAVLVIVFVLAAIVACALLFGELPEESGAESSASVSAAAETSSSQPTGLQFPYILEEQNIEICSLLEASIANPDAGGETAENIAGLELKNTTGMFISFASFEAALSDGITFRFEIHDLPADGTMTAFDINNSVYDRSVPCDSVTCTGLQTVSDDRLLMDDSISVSAEGTAVTLTNTTDTDLGPLTVICLCSLNGSYFGGTSYSYPVDAVPAGESVTLQAAECYLGSAVVVRIVPED
ncbi:MAG: hypothetical protein ACI4GO_00620 [Hominenteromicrobium sp.]